MAEVLVVGAGYVGLVSATCLAKLGHNVSILEMDPDKVTLLHHGIVPIQEPELQELWAEGAAAGRLHPLAKLDSGIRGIEIVMLAVGTPSSDDGSPDLSQVFSAVDEIGRLAGDSEPIVVTKSTVPVGTAEAVSQRLSELGWRRPRVVSNPEFLREGRAVVDFLRPDRIVVGSEDEEAAREVAALYQILRRPLIVSSSRTAEMIKYASNVFLCTKVSFINEVANLCDGMSVDIKDVSRALELDPRMGFGYFDAGLGWGGSCLPKDIKALLWMADDREVPMPMLRSALEINDFQPRRVVDLLDQAIGSLQGRTIGLLGLTFKPNCDDLRESPALRLASELASAGCRVRAFDPVAGEAAELQGKIELQGDPYQLAEGADALVVTSGWSQFDALDFERLASVMRTPVFLDARNSVNPERVRRAGLQYIGIGRGLAPVAVESGRRRGAQA